MKKQKYVLCIVCLLILTLDIAVIFAKEPEPNDIPLDNEEQSQDERHPDNTEGDIVVDDENTQPTGPDEIVESYSDNETTTNNVAEEHSEQEEPKVDANDNLAKGNIISMRFNDGKLYPSFKEDVSDYVLYYNIDYTSLVLDYTTSPEDSNIKREEEHLDNGDIIIKLVTANHTYKIKCVKANATDIMYKGSIYRIEHKPHDSNLNIGFKVKKIKYKSGKIQALCNDEFKLKFIITRNLVDNKQQWFLLKDKETVVPVNIKKIGNDSYIELEPQAKVLFGKYNGKLGYYTLKDGKIKGIDTKPKKNTFKKSIIILDLSLAFLVCILIIRKVIKKVRKSKIKTRVIRIENYLE